MAISTATKHIVLPKHGVDMLMDLKLDWELNIVCGFVLYERPLSCTMLMLKNIKYKLISIYIENSKQFY